MPKFDPTKFNPKDELVVLLRESGVDLSDGKQYATGDAVWFTVKYVEHFEDSFEFISEDRDQHGTVLIQRHVLEGTEHAYNVYSLDEHARRKYPGLAETYEYCEIVPVSWVKHWRGNEDLRIETPSWDDDPEVIVERAKSRLVPFQQPENV